MPYTKLQFRPGINREVTSHTNEGGWVDCDKIRFRMGFPETIGGWERATDVALLGTVRALHTWVSLSNESYIAAGSHLKFYNVRVAYLIQELRRHTNAVKSQLDRWREPQ